ncbi:MAG: metallophosphoesterase family protein [Abditibacteriota bacterium]|nr:metallophosphoesterase family protein [Abditibacteriota bacterium]
MKFLCTSDLHLGRCSSIPSDPLGLDLSAQGALDRLVKAANRKRVDWLLIAGDIADRKEKWLVSCEILKKAFEALDPRTGIAVISGNHDYDSLEKICSRLEIDTGRRIVYLNGRYHIDGGPDLLGYPFGTPGLKKRLLEERGPNTIVLYHGDHTGDDEKYGGLTAGERSDLSENSFFTVCGHNHYPDMPCEGFFNCGSPQALDASDGGKNDRWHGAWLAEDRKNYSHIPISTVRYARIEADVAGDIHDAIDEAEKTLCGDEDRKKLIVADVILGGFGDGESEKKGLEGLFRGRTFVRRVTDETLPADAGESASPSAVLYSLLKKEPDAPLGRDGLLAKARDLIRENTKFLEQFDLEFTPEEEEAFFDEAAAALIREIYQLKKENKKK